MAKTGTQIQAWAESLTEQITFASAGVIIWLNEFLTQEIGADAMLLDTEDYTNTDRNTWYALPLDYDSAVKVEEYGSSSMGASDFWGQYYDYTVFNTNIQLKTDGNYRLHYAKLPAEIAAIGDSLGIDDCFNKAAALWVAYRGLTNDDEDNAYPNSLGRLRLQEYLSEKEVAVRKRKKRFRLPSRIRNVQAW